MLPRSVRSGSPGSIRLLKIPGNRPHLRSAQGRPVSGSTLGPGFVGTALSETSGPPRLDPPSRPPFRATYAAALVPGGRLRHMGVAESLGRAPGPYTGATYGRAICRQTSGGRRAMGAGRCSRRGRRRRRHAAAARSFGGWLGGRRTVLRHDLLHRRGSAVLSPLPRGTRGAGPSDGPRGSRQVPGWCQIDRFSGPARLPDNGRDPARRAAVAARRGCGRR